MDEALPILLIEDDEDYRVLLQDLLSEVESPRYRLDWEADPQRGLQRLLEGKHVACLLDYRLGAETGLDLLRAARARGCDTPAILLTAQGERSVDMEAMRAGAADFLLKGRIDGQQLERALRYALERHRAARALRHSEERARQLAAELQAILRTLPDVIVRMDEEGRVLDCHAGQGTCLLGPDPGAVRGRLLSELLPEPARPELTQGLQAMAQGRQAQLECSLPTPHGERHLELRLTPLRDVPGASCLAIVQDVTERRRRDAMLVQATKLAAIGELAGNVAHEVNNPMGIISAKARLLLSDPRHGLAPRVEQELTKIVEQCDRITHLTRSLLDFARPTQQHREPVDVHQPLHKALTMVSGRAQRGHIAVTEQFAPDAPPVRANSNELQQVFLNLLINAADAMPQGGSIVATVRHRGVTAPGGEPGVEVSIADTGMGIADDVLPRIFEPFFTTKEAVKGTGLGLSICLGIVRSHGGSLEVETTPREGTRFTITLPAAL